MASLSRVLVNISHNLNTPIGSSITLLFYAEKELSKVELNLKDDTPSKPNLEQYVKKLREAYSLIQKELSRTTDFVERIKAIGNFEENHDKKTYNLKIYLLSLVNNMFKKELDDKNILVNIDCDSDVELFISSVL